LSFALSEKEKLLSNIIAHQQGWLAEDVVPPPPCSTTDHVSGLGYDLIATGSTLGFAVNSGRIAGENALKYMGK